jgi:ABC-2 type transport system permease protein
MTLVAVPFLGMTLPASPGAALGFLFALLAAVLLSASLATAMAASLLWTLAGEGAWQLLAVSIWLFSGIMIPLPFFPDWLQPVLRALPFRGLMDVPFRIYTGHIPVSAALPTIMSVLAWAAALFGLGRILLARGTRKLVVQGG